MRKPHHKIVTERDGDVLVLHLTGRASPFNATQIASEVTAIAEAERAQRVLIDCTQLEGRLGVVDTYFHVRSYPSTAYRPSRVAVLDRPEHASYFSFHETAAANVGYSHLRYFADAAEARHWLGLDDGAAPPSAAPA